MDVMTPRCHKACCVSQHLTGADMICSLVKLPSVDKQEDLHENIKRLPGYLSGCVTIHSHKTCKMSSIPICFPFILPSPFRPKKKNIQHHTTTTITTKPRSWWWWWWPGQLRWWAWVTITGINSFRVWSDHRNPGIQIPVNGLQAGHAGQHSQGGGCTGQTWWIRWTGYRWWIPKLPAKFGCTAQETIIWQIYALRVDYLIFWFEWSYTPLLARWRIYSW